MADVAGRYRQAGPIGYLELKPSGEYECFVVNGVTVDGCGTFVGAGLSRGAWSCREEAIAFDPVTEPEDLVLNLIGASAVPSEQGLVLTAGGEAHFLAREKAPSGGVGRPPQSGQPGTEPSGRSGG